MAGPLRPSAGGSPDAGPDDDPVRLLHTLQVHQAELAQQNEELLQTRADLSASLGHLSDLFQGAPVGLLSVHADGVIVDINPLARELLGPAAAPGTSLLSQVSADSQPTLRQALKQAEARQAGEAVIAAVLTTGHAAMPRHLQVAVRAGTEGEDQLLLSLTDVTEARRAQAELQQTQEILALSNRAARIGHWEIDLGSGRIRLSDVMREIHGVPHDLEVDEATAESMYPEGAARDTLRAALRTAATRGEPFDVELQIAPPPAGQLLWVRLIGIPQMSGRRCLRIYGTCQDIDTRAKLEQSRLAQARAEAASRAKTAFLSRMSHELRTPLNAILGFTELLALDANLRASPVAMQQVQHVMNAGEQLLTLVDEVLDLARIESGTLQLQAQELDLAAVAAECRELVLPLAQQHRVALLLHPAEGPVRLHADRARLVQVVTNLLSNAVKFNRPGGLVDILLSGTADEVLLSVHDTGRGMTAEHLAELFQPFNRLGAEHGAVPGTGLGLVITRQVVEAMGGRLAVHSRPGTGATFTVHLPRSPVATPASAPAAS